MNEPVNILSFDDVTVEPGADYEAGIARVNLQLAPGGLALVLLEAELDRIPLADAAEGLVAPARGTLRFLGEDWQTMAADRVARQRGRIGRVFEGDHWLSDLDVDQDITLAQRHHTRRTLEDIEEEAVRLCRVFGLPGLPGGRPSSLSRQDLQRAACARAFLGEPVLILLENPLPSICADVVPALAKTVHEARQRGAAVLWTTNDLQVWNHPDLRPTMRRRMAGSHMQVMGEPEGAA